MAMIARITKAYTRHYRDSGQCSASVEWVDTKGNAGRTEGLAVRERGSHTLRPFGWHMEALFNRARREGIPISQEVGDMHSSAIAHEFRASIWPSARKPSHVS